jgi:hypothetical protein
MNAEERRYFNPENLLEPGTMARQVVVFEFLSVFIGG